MSDWSQGWYVGARVCASPNCGPRPLPGETPLAVLHSISLPPGEFGGDAIEQLFTNRLDWDAHSYYAQIRGLTVSAHFLIRRGGELVQFVACDERAWHAGESCWRGRNNCNDYSIGIELEGLEGEPFERDQYTTLVTLLRTLEQHWGVHEVVGHEHIAPGRKFDPGAGFDWTWLAQALQSSRALRVACI